MERAHGDDTGQRQQFDVLGKVRIHIGSGLFDNLCSSSFGRVASPDCAAMAVQDPHDIHKQTAAKSVHLQLESWPASAYFSEQLPEIPSKLSRKRNREVVKQRVRELPTPFGLWAPIRAREPHVGYTQRLVFWDAGEVPAPIGFARIAEDEGPRMRDDISPTGANSPSVLECEDNLGDVKLLFDRVTVRRGPVH